MSPSANQLRIASGLALAFLLILFVLVGSQLPNLAPVQAVPSTNAATEPGDAALDVLQVGLLRPCENVKGFTWPKKGDGDYEGWGAKERLHKLVLTFPGGRSITTLSIRTDLFQTVSTVDGVKFVTTLKPLPYQEAAHELWRELDRFGCTVPPGERQLLMKDEKLNGDLDSRGQMRQPGGADVNGDDKTGCFFEVCPALGGWYLSYEFGLSTPERHKLSQKWIGSLQRKQSAATRAAPK